MYFLGFPFGRYVDVGEMHNRFPLPFIKRAVVSALNVGKENPVYLDGHNNRGFSGGPVAFQHFKTKEWRVGLTMSAYATTEEPLLTTKGPSPTFKVEQNTGLIVAHHARCATDVIENNPIGFKV